MIYSIPFFNKQQNFNVLAYNTNSIAQLIWTYFIM